MLKPNFSIWYYDTAFRTTSSLCQQITWKHGPWKRFFQISLSVPVQVSRFSIHFCELWSIFPRPESRLHIATLHCKRTYRELQLHAPKPQDFMQHAGRAWILDRTLPPSSWSIFMKSIKTNNGIECWHLGLSPLRFPLYLLITLLHSCEACETSLQIRLVLEKKLRRISSEYSLSEFSNITRNVTITYTSRLAHSLQICAKGFSPLKSCFDQLFQEAEILSREY